MAGVIVRSGEGHDLPSDPGRVVVYNHVGCHCHSSNAVRVQQIAWRVQLDMERELRDLLLGS